MTYSNTGHLALQRQLAFLCKGWVGDRSIRASQSIFYNPFSIRQYIRHLKSFFHRLEKCKNNSTKLHHKSPTIGSKVQVIPHTKVTNGRRQGAMQIARRMQLATQEATDTRHYANE